MDESEHFGDGSGLRDNARLTYIHVREWVTRTPVAPCAKCGRFTNDPTRSAFGQSIEAALFEYEHSHLPTCPSCIEKALNESFEASTLAMLERRFGIAEKDRDALKAFMETIFTDPGKILKLEQLHGRVGSLERDTTFWKGVAIFAAGVAMCALGLAVTALITTLTA